MKTNKGTCGSPLHICSFCFFLSPLSSSSPLLTGVSWYTGFYWSGPSSEESVCCLYQQRSPCVFMAKDWSETRAAQTAAGKHVAVRLQLMDWKTSWRLASHFPPFPLLSGSEERRVCLWGYMREDSKYKRAMSHTCTPTAHFSGAHCKSISWTKRCSSRSHSSFYSLGSKEEHCEWTGLFPEMDQARWIPESLSEEKPTTTRIKSLKEVYVKSMLCFLF